MNFILSAIVSRLSIHMQKSEIKNFKNNYNMSSIRRNKKVYCDVLAYYIIDSELYQMSMRTRLTEDESKLPPVEIFKKYGCYLSKYSFMHNEFAEWDAIYYETFDSLPYDMSKSQEVNVEDLEKAVKKAKSEFEKKFNDFPLDGTLYTSTHEDGIHYGGGMCFPQCFQAIVKPKKKLVNEGVDDIVRKMILEIEILDGIHSETKREFIPFCKFVEQYTPGCDIKVIDSNDHMKNKIEDYFTK